MKQIPTRVVTRASILLPTIVLIPTLIFAQAGGATAEIKGKVTDPNGGGVAGGSVTVTDAAKGISRTVMSDAQGEYRVLSLPPGTYQIKVEAQGFKTQILNEAQVTVGQTAQHDFILEVGAVTEMVNITSEAPVIESDRTQQSNTINEQAIRNLPIDRRDYLTYTLLAPGVVDSNALADNADFRVSQTPQSGLSFYGNNGRGNSITVDGAEANEANGGVRPTLGQDAVQEFQVNRSNYNAELGGASGGVINIVSKTGTNNVHGNVFGFFRSQKLDAGDPFAIVFNRATNTATRIKPPANRQQLGGSIGFPLVKDKTFAFVSYEHLRRRESSAVPLLTSTSIFNPTAGQTALINALAANTSTTPVQCLRGGIPNVTGGSPTNPADIVNATPAACAVLLRSALTTHTPVQNLFFNNSGVFPFSSNSNAFSARIDHNLSQNNVFFFRYNFNKSDEGNQSTRALLGFSRSNNVDTLDHTAVAGWTHIFNSNLINELRVQGNYRRFEVTTNDPNGPEFNVSGFGFFNRDIFLPHTTIERRAEFSDNTSYSTGKHKFKFGANVLIHGGYFDPATFFAGRFFFDPQPAAVAGALVSPCMANPQSCGAAAGVASSGINSLQALDLGVPRAFQIGFGPNQPGKSIIRATLPHYGFYAQDTWNVLPNLTLNYGLRYELDQRKKPLRTFTKNFGPRVGLSWDPFKNGKTSVRAGYGIFYAEIPFVIDYVVTGLNELTGPDSGVQTPMLQPNCGGNPCFRQTPNLATVLSPASTATSANNMFRTLLAQGVFLQSNTVRQINEADLAQFGIPVSQTGPRNSLTVLFRADPTYRNPMAQQASFAIDRELSPGLSISASYTWVLTNYLTRARDINLRQRPINTNPAVGPVGIRLWSAASGCAGAGVFNCFVNPTIFQEIIYESSQSASYNGAIFEVQKRFSNRLSFAANYTYSKAFDQVTDYNSDFRAMDQTDQDAERALSAFDQRHKFVAYAVIQSPYQNAFVRDFTLTPIFRANSGRPFNLLAGSDVNGDRSGNGDRPPLVARNTGKGPNFWTLDMRVGRSINLGAETRSLELTFEVFNLFNRLNHSSVNNFVGTDTPCGLLPAGTPLLCNPDLAGGNVTGRHDRSPSQSLGFTGAFDPRRIQLGARFKF